MTDSKKNSATKNIPIQNYQRAGTEKIWKNIEPKSKDTFDTQLLKSKIF